MGLQRGAQASEHARKVIGSTAFAHDLTELPGTLVVDSGLLYALLNSEDLTQFSAGLDYLAFPNGPIEQSQKLASRAFGANQTWFLVNGTTTGIHAAIMASCRPGDCLLLARNCHQSAFAAAVFAGKHMHRKLCGKELARRYLRLLHACSKAILCCCQGLPNSL